MCKDLVVNIRNQVVKRQEHTHNYVYKLRGLLAKAPGWTYVQRWNLSRGFSTRFTRHKIWIYSLLDLAGGFLQKTPFFFLCTNRSGNRGPPAVLVAGGTGAPAT
jgi:hypothetical protein